MTYSVQIVDPEAGTNESIKVPSDEYILDAAEEQNVDIPYSCRAGKCVSCVGKVISGTVEQDHDFLKPNEIEAGFVLTCMAYASSDCVIHTNQEEALFEL